MLLRPLRSSILRSGVFKCDFSTRSCNYIMTETAPVIG